jgi:arginine repressor
MFKPLKHSVKQDSMRIQEEIKQMFQKTTLNCSWSKTVSRALKSIGMLEKNILSTLREN